MPDATARARRTTRRTATSNVMSEADLARVARLAHP
jgi:hypothetical protein